jgi:hypothetical protein
MDDGDSIRFYLCLSGIASDEFNRHGCQRKDVFSERKKQFKIDPEPLFMCLAVTHVLPRANGHFF